MMRESELRIKNDNEVAHKSREGYVREERGEPEKVISKILYMMGKTSLAVEADIMFNSC